jgi:hypothetical protein
MADPASLLSGPLWTERLPDGRRELLRDLVVEINGEKIVIPAGTITDYSSIPQVVAWLVRWSRVDVAGVVHDYLYQTGSRPRAEADAIWRTVARSGECRANRVQGWLGWAGLRVGGWWAWRKHRKKD